MKRTSLGFILSMIFFVQAAFSQKLLTAIDIGGQAWAPAANLTTNMVYVPNSGLNTLTVISGTSETVVANIPMPYQPLAAVVNPTTNLVYVATDSENSDDGAIAVVDGSSNTVVATIPMWPIFTLAVNPATNLVYIETAAETISVLDASTNQIVNTVDTGVSGYIQGISVNTITNRIYATVNTFESNGAQLVAIDGSTNSIQVFPLNGSIGVGAPTVDNALNRVYVPLNVPEGLLVLNGSSGKIIANVLPQCDIPATVSTTTHLVADFYYDYQRERLALGFFNPQNFAQVGSGVDMPPNESPNAITAGANNRYYVNFFDNVKVHTSVAVISGP
jgi:hypothetical protein